MCMHKLTHELLWILCTDSKRFALEKYLSVATAAVVLQQLPTRFLRDDVMWLSMQHLTTLFANSKATDNVILTVCYQTKLLPYVWFGPQSYIMDNLEVSLSCFYPCNLHFHAATRELQHCRASVVFRLMGGITIAHHCWRFGLITLISQMVKYCSLLLYLLSSKKLTNIF